MNLNEFINYRKRCMVCGNKNILMMTGTLRENIGDTSVHCIFNYIIPVLRKDFMTFAIGNFAILTPDQSLDLETLNKDKYNTFVLKNYDTVSFDRAFAFKMKLNFRVSCPEHHYVYNSRSIKVSNKSSDITKGYPVINEEIVCDNYRVVSSMVDKATYIFNYESSNEPTTIPYMDMSSFPCDDSEKFIKKIQNILLLA